MRSARPTAALLACTVSAVALHTTTLRAEPEASPESAVEASDPAEDATPNAAGPAATPPPARDGAIIGRSTQTRRVYQNDRDSGRIVIVAAPLGFLIRTAYGVHPRDIVYEVPVKRGALYDARVDPADGQPQTAQRLLRERLEQTFRFEAVREDRLVPVRILRRVDGGATLTEAKSGRHRAIGSRGRFEGVGASMGDLTRFTRTYTAKPVVDETGLTGRYDFVLEWDPNAGQRGLVQAFGGLGLELSEGKREVSLLVVRPQGAEGQAPNASAPAGHGAEPVDG